MTEPYIETVSGKRLHFLDPAQNEIDIEDIAHALSMQCRYTGHTRKFYSVAEHCVLVASLITKPELRIQALLHDASEAYLTDIASPVKAHLQNYREMESTLMHAIAKKFSFTWPEHEDVRIADRWALLIEARTLLPSGGRDWPEFRHYRYVEFPDVKVHCYPPEIARHNFLDMYYEIRSCKAVHV